MLRVGLVGCGTIGSRLAHAIEQSYGHAARLVGLHDRDAVRAIALRQQLRHQPPVLELPALVQRSQLILEAASIEIVPQVVRAALRAGCDVFVMSVGGLLRVPEWQRLAQQAGRRMYVPSGALAGLDGVKALATGRIRRLSLTTRKPARALADAPYVRRRGLRLDRLRRAKLIFTGSPAAAVAAFPQNTNIAAALALASQGSSRQPRIRVIADPQLRMNRHELDIEGDCGRIRCVIESRPSANPKTSELAVRSAIATLERLFSPIQIGT